MGAKENDSHLSSISARALAWALSPVLTARSFLTLKSRFPMGEEAVSKVAAGGDMV